MMGVPLQCSAILVKKRSLQISQGQSSAAHLEFWPCLTSLTFHSSFKPPTLPPVMKGLSSSRSHHHVISYEPSYDPLGHHVDRKPYLISHNDIPVQIAVPHPSELPYYNAQRTSYPSDSNSNIPYGTFPRRCHSTSSSHHPEVKDECMAIVPYVGGGGGGGGGGYGSKTPTQVPATFADPLERQSLFPRDGYHTLQYKRGMLGHSGGIVANNNDSPGRIRHLVHSVQKLFTKSHSLEGPHHTQCSKGASNGSINGGLSVSGGGVGGGGSRASIEGETPLIGPSQRKRSKSRERCRSAEPKHRNHHHRHHQLHGSASTPGSGYWSSDDNLERELCLYQPHPHQTPLSPSISPSPIAMTMGRYTSNVPEKFPQTPLPNLSSSQSHQYFMIDPYATLNEHTHSHAHHSHTHHHSALKASRSNNDVKYAVSSTCVPVSGSSKNSGDGIGGGSGSLLPLGLVDGPLMKKGACSSSLTVPQDEWSSFSPLVKEDDIPCRRMRSGSYVKAMAEDDSGDSDGSPKPSPKIQARRASYLKATQPSLTEMTTLQISTEHSPKLQIRSHSYLRAVSEVSINRSLDTLDPKTLLDPKMLLSSPQYRSRNESYMRAMSTISQLSEVEVNGQIEQVYSEMQSQAMGRSMDNMDTMDTLPMPGSFRMRSHSYVRAIDQGCAGEEEGKGGRPLLILPSSPPRTSATTVRTIQSSTVSSCITTYKKTPPPVPPRTSTCSSKPYISITAQSSTESAQDAYMEEEGPRGDMTIQSRLSNSTESIDSMKALTAAIEAANAQVHGPASQHVSSSTMTVSPPKPSVLSRRPAVEDYQDDYRKDALRKGKCLSIGIQVDGPEEIPDPEDPSKFTSVGVQVEDHRGYRRCQRSNSVTAAVQADLDIPDLLGTPLDSPDTDMEILPSGVLSRQYSRDAATSTVVQRSVCQRDGRWFLKLLQAESDRMEGWCRQMELDQRENALPEDILGKMRSAVGSAQLLISQKFQQFRELCEENLNPNAHPRPIASDLAGFWDMIQLSIENISLKFDELHQLRANNWRPVDPPERKERPLPPSVAKKPPKGPHHHPPLVRDRSLESSEKQRQEARKRLMAAKRAASVRQNSATESADSIEIYIPEAQTRL
uniref:Discs, large (Drosophila) homolog-associated protein 1a n=2 Tax=Takifugu rubripes TaxID=31033 RepID=H2T3M9_TAKRU